MVALDLIHCPSARIRLPHLRAHQERSAPVKAAAGEREGRLGTTRKLREQRLIKAAGHRQLPYWNDEDFGNCF